MGRKCCNVTRVYKKRNFGPHAPLIMQICRHAVLYGAQIKRRGVGCLFRGLILKARSFSNIEKKSHYV